MPVWRSPTTPVPAAVSVTNLPVMFSLTPSILPPQRREVLPVKRSGVL